MSEPVDDGKVCHYCRLPTPQITRDHIVPRVFKPIVVRLVPACGDCNMSKSAMRVVVAGRHHCDECARAWVAFGPAGWYDTVPTIELYKVTRKRILSERATRSI